MRPVLFFDLNGTLVDLASLDPHFDQVFGSAHTRVEWFSELIQMAMAATITNHYQDFSVLAKAALQVVARRRHHHLSQEHQTQILQAARRMPAFPDVKPGLDRLRAAKFRMVVLTNSPLGLAEPVLTESGLLPYFERVLSVDAVRRFKPAAEVYQMAARELKIKMDRFLMVAAHSWDTTGAIRAGGNAAFLERPGQVLDPLAPRPRFHASNLKELAEQLVALEPE